MASLSARTKQLTKPFSLATVLVIMSCCTHFVLAARELTTAGDDKAMRVRYEKWMAEHGRTYKDSAEKARRFEVFKSNADFIDSYNAATRPEDKGRPGLATNKFADLTQDEFNNMYLFGPTTRPSTSPLLESQDIGTGFMYGNVMLSDIPASIDWREKGAVTPVKNQLGCKCCWAFSAAAAVEGIHQIRTNDQVSLSAQELVDCSTGSNNKGCDLGDTDEAFKHIARRGGITSEQDYEYEGYQGTCRASGKQAAATISGFQRVPKQNETALLLAVAHQPVSISLDGSSDVFRFFGTGVYGPASKRLAASALNKPCTTTDLNHAVTVVGYGTDEDGVKYWLIKNSWGVKWGDQGYAKILRDVAYEAGFCGLAMEPCYPVA